MLWGIANVRTDLAPRERLEQAYNETSVTDLTSDYNWYTTVVLERTLDVTERSGIDLGVLFLDEHWELERTSVEYAAPVLDVVTSILSTIVDPGVFDALVISDRVHLFADGKRPSGIPVMTGSGTANLIRGGEAATEQLGQRIRLLSQLNTTNLHRHEWLGRVAYWRVQSLRESDPWKRFLWSFVALEILTNKLYESRRADVIGRLRLLENGGAVTGDPPLDELVWGDKRATLRSRFALVASDFFPESARADLTEFAAASKARSRLVHGALRDAEQLPTASVQGLLDKYYGAAVKKLLLGMEPMDSW
jgi:hypothetical protein